MKQRPRIGVVLSSGGLRGVFAHTGFMRVLQELDIRIDAIAGCSAGAVVGGVFASGTPLKQWMESLDRMTQQDFWERRSSLRFLWSHLLHKGRGYLGLSSTASALRFSYENLSVKTFEQCVIPFYSLAINLGSGEKTVFSSGELAPRIVASSAVPVLYEPIYIDGNYYCDGAIIDFAPTDAICCKHGLDVVIVHHVSQKDADSDDIEKLKQRPWALLEIINRLLFRQQPWYLDNKPINIQHCPCGCGAIIIALEPTLPELDWPSIVGGKQLQADARSQALQQLRPHVDVLNADNTNKLQTLVNLKPHEQSATHKKCI